MKRRIKLTVSIKTLSEVQYFREYAESGDHYSASAKIVRHNFTNYDQQLNVVRHRHNRLSKPGNPGLKICNFREELHKEVLLLARRIDLTLIETKLKENTSENIGNVEKVRQNERISAARSKKVELVIRLFRSGHTKAQIAEQLSVGFSSIRKILRSSR
jgi:hypothetical protein